MSQLLLNHVVSIEVDPIQICDQKFASVRWKDFQLNEFLVQQKQIGAPIAKDLIMEHCKKLWKASPQTPVIEYNNNNNNSSGLHIGNTSKTPTDLAREQLAARLSLSARLNVHRTLTTTPERPQKAAAGNEYISPAKQQVQPQNQQVLPTPLANLVMSSICLYVYLCVYINSLFVFTDKCFACAETRLFCTKSIQSTTCQSSIFRAIFGCAAAHAQCLHAQDKSQATEYVL